MNEPEPVTRKLKMLASDLYLMDPRYRICYFVPHPDQNLAEASLFQGATKGLVDTARLLEEVMIHPADVRELTASWRDIAIFRTAGLITHKIFPVEHSAFKEVVNWPAVPPFRCVVSTDENADFVDECLSSQQDAWLHLSTTPASGRHDLFCLSRQTVLDYVRHRLDRLEGDAEYGAIVEIIRSFLTKNLPASRRISLPRTSHNLTRPNEIALMAFGCKLPDGPGSPETERRATQWIVRSADFVDRQRRELLADSQCSFSVNALLLTVPSNLRGHRKLEFLERLRQTVGVSNAPVGRLIRAFVNPTSYLWHIDKEKLERFFGEPIGQALLVVRREELVLYTTILTRLSAESLLPTLRLSPLSNQAWGHLKQLADCARSDGPRKERKLRRLFENAQTALETGLDQQFKDRFLSIGHRVQGIKLVSDLPLEWVRDRGVPLMLRHECSRIPTVPTSLGYGVATNQDPLPILPSQLTDILIIRSFSSSDRVRSVLESALGRSADEKTSWQVKIRFVDVDTADQIIEALNSHAGAIVVFDCHGSFEENEYLSSLVIGGEPVRLWELRKHIRRMPPIVLLSACDTLPVDGSHASVASTMLLLGARTVLATLLPIDSRKAAIFLARLFLRIGEFVPLALKNRSRLNWREVVSGMTKMLHVSECLWNLTGQGVLDSEGFGHLHLRANMDINSLNPNWFEDSVERLASYLGCSIEEANTHLGAGVGLTDALMHVQLGNPELLWLVGEEAEKAA